MQTTRNVTMFLHNRTDLDEMIDHRSYIHNLRSCLILYYVCTKGPFIPTKHYLNQVKQNENKQQKYWKTQF